MKKRNAKYAAAAKEAQLKYYLETVEMIFMKTKKVSREEEARRKRVLYWTIFVIAINIPQLFFKNIFIEGFAMIGTIYALYRLVVFDNKKNRLSRKYYDWKGRPLDAKNKN